MKLSILTPTYNRENTLKRLYTSIKNNKTNVLDIEWLIMDDGSQDNTREIVDKFIAEKTVDIKYYYQENQGKMVAINNLVKNASGELIVECDSDDYFCKNAFKTIAENVVLEDDIYAYAFLKYDQNECNIGGLFPNEKTTMFDLYFKNGESGEKALVFNAKVRKQYKHELFSGEKFVTESRMYHKMDVKYKIKGLNLPLMICEYQKDRIY